MAKIIVPKFLKTEYLQSGTKEDKEEMLQKAADWLQLGTTQSFLKYIEELQKEEEEKELHKSDFLTLFQSKYWAANNKGKRVAYQTILKLLK